MAEARHPRMHPRYAACFRFALILWMSTCPHMCGWKGSKRVVGEVEKLEGARVQTASLFDASWKDQPIEWSKAPVVPIFDEDWANRCAVHARSHARSRSCSR